tara:strand:- start:1437 stop:1835 length:399 start_codon:yes stop_codon:yes gene_type:complete
MRSSDRRSSAALFKAKGLARTEAPPVKEDEEVPNVIGGASGAYGGAKVGAALGAKAAPFLAAVPVVGPALAAAAPVAGGVIGGVAGGVTGVGGSKGAVQAYKGIGEADDLYEAARKDAAKKMLAKGQEAWWM